MEVAQWKLPNGSWPVEVAYPVALGNFCFGVSISGFGIAGARKAVRRESRQTCMALAEQASGSNLTIACI